MVQPFRGSNLTKMAESYPNGWKTLWKKEKLLVMSNFSFSHCFQKTVTSNLENYEEYDNECSEEW